MCISKKIFDIQLKIRKKIKEGNECKKYIQRRYKKELGMWTIVAKATEIAGEYVIKTEASCTRKKVFKTGHTSTGCKKWLPAGSRFLFTISNII